MRHPKLIIAGIGLAAVAAAGGVTAAAAAGGPFASNSTAGHAATAATVRTASATVAGKTETILVNSGGLPLYFYRPDTAARSFVTGGVAALWPPLRHQQRSNQALRQHHRHGRRLEAEVHAGSAVAYLCGGAAWDDDQLVSDLPDRVLTKSPRRCRPSG